MSRGNDPNDERPGVIRFRGLVFLACLAAFAGCAAPRAPSVTQFEKTFPVTPPLPEPYRIGLTDELRIIAYRRDEFSILFDVNPAAVLPDGTIVLPLLGEVRAVGLGPDELRQVITRGLRQALRNGADYRLEPGDQLRLTVHRQSDLSPLFDLDPAVVLPDGKLVVPLVGEVPAAGLTPEQLRREISARLETVLVQPVVSVVAAPRRSPIEPVVSVTLQPRNPKIYVLGEVRNPGVYEIDRDSTAIEALALAGGMTRDADRRRVLVLRTRAKDSGAAAVGAISFEDLVREADVRQNIVLRAGDILYVPPDYIARADRVLLHVANIVSPFAQLLGVISQIVILERVGRRGE